MVDEGMRVIDSDEEIWAILNGVHPLSLPPILSAEAPVAFKSDPLRYLTDLTSSPAGEAALLHSVVTYAKRVEEEEYLAQRDQREKIDFSWQGELSLAWLSAIVEKNSPDSKTLAARPLVSYISKMVDRPLVANPKSSCTPKWRTPWGGKKYLEFLKGLGMRDLGCVGEIWAISGHPKYPSSYPAQYGGSLIEIPMWLIGMLAPKKMYGDKNIEKFGAEPPFLLKYLNSASHDERRRGSLSVQIHPTDGYIAASGEKGKNWHSKSEAWIIIGSDEGAGLYVGFKAGVAEALVRKTRDEGGDITDLMNFIEVKPGDKIFIPAGTPHAIAGGIELLEIQETSETTFRYYDYGRLDERGNFRELHFDDAIGTTDWDHIGIDYVREYLMIAPRLISKGPGSPKQERMVEDRLFQLDRLTFRSSDKFEGDSSHGIQGLIVISGSVTMSDRDGNIIATYKRGHSIALPAAFGRYALRADSDAEIYISRSDDIINTHPVSC